MPVRHVLVFKWVHEIHARTIRAELTNRVSSRYFPSLLHALMRINTCLK